MIAPTLTPIELAALEVFAAKAGRTWKMALRSAWITGEYPVGTSTDILHPMRFTHGSAWLTRFSLPIETNRTPVNKPRFARVEESIDHEVVDLEESGSKFAAHEYAVLMHSIPVAHARSKTMARRIANALNIYRANDDAR